MKHIKTYESIKPGNNFKYKVNDYVLINARKTKNIIFSFPFYKNYGVIMNIPKQRLDDKDPMYDIYAINNDTLKLSEITDFYILQSIIKRKLTPEEIEDFNTIITANKFNL